MTDDDAIARRGRFFRVTAAFWACCIVALCVWPHPHLPEQAQVEHFDKVVHAGIFVVQSFLLRGAGFRNTWTIVLGSALAVGTEILQAGIPALGRSGDLLDALADFAGLTFGLLLFRLWTLHRTRRAVS